MKECCTCHVPKLLEDFNKRKSSPDGRQDRCRQCQKDWYRENAEEHKKNTAVHKKNHRARNRRWLLDYLAQHPCVDCGETEPATLDFDHVRDKKSYNVSYLIGNARSITVIQTEVAKCEVRCANCHRRKTAKQFGWYALLDDAA